MNIHCKYFSSLLWPMRFFISPGLYARCSLCCAVSSPPAFLSLLLLELESKRKYPVLQEAIILYFWIVFLICPVASSFPIKNKQTKNQPIKQNTHKPPKSSTQTTAFHCRAEEKVRRFLLEDVCYITEYIWLKIRLHQMLSHRLNILE